jgi:hypothetical protein
MGLKKAELYRGFNVFTEEVRPGVWVFSLVEIPAEPGGHSRTPQHGRVAGEHASRDAALAAARAHVDRIQQNRRNRSQA